MTGKNVILEIRAGAGGEEAALFAALPAADVHHVRRCRRGAGGWTPWS